MLAPRWSKVVRDLWSNKTRTIMVVLSIAVGVFAFGSVFISREVLMTDMDAQYMAINPTTISMSMSPFDDNLVRWTRRQTEVLDAQGVAVYLVKLVGGNASRNLNLYGVNEPGNMSLNMLKLERGSWPTGRREIVLERSSVPLAGAQIGDSIVIELSNGHRYELTVSGIIHDVNAIPANMFPQLTGYVSMRTLEELGLPGTYNRLDIASKGEFDTKEKLEKVADNLKGRLQDIGASVYSVQVTKPGEHWATNNTKSFTLIMTFIGVFSLVLSAFLVINTISALLAEQKRQIGIMKAVGGRAGQIISIYLVLVTFYGLLALIVALPIGMGLAYLFTNMVVQFLNVDILHFHLPLQVFLMQVVAALVVPLLASAIPVFGGVRTTVREAISSHGIGHKAGHGLFDRLMMRVRGLPRPVLLSLRNTFRRKGRLAMTLGTLAISGTLFITVVNVRGSLMSWSNDLLKTWFNYEAELYLDGGYQAQSVVRRAESLPGVTQAEGRTGIRVQYIKPDGSKGATFPIAGLPPSTDFINPTLLSGRWLQNGDRNAVVLSSYLVKDIPDVRVGDKIVADTNGKKYTWEVVGIMYMPMDKFGYANFDYVSSVGGETGMATQLYIRTLQKDSQSQIEMAQALEHRLKNSGIKVSQWLTRDSLSSTWSGQFDFLVFFLMAMAAMTALIGALGLAGMMSLNVMERVREIGVMRSIGASNRMISGIVVIEGLVIGLISWGIAIPLSIPMSFAFDAMLGNALLSDSLPFVFSIAGPVAWLLIVSAIGAVASLLPAFRASRISIRETLAYE